MRGAASLGARGKGSEMLLCVWRRAQRDPLPAVDLQVDVAATAQGGAEVSSTASPAAGASSRAASTAT